MLEPPQNYLNSKEKVIIGDTRANPIRCFSRQGHRLERSALENFAYFLLAWIFTTFVFSAIKGRMMNFFEGLIYPIGLTYAIAFFFR